VFAIVQNDLANHVIGQPNVSSEVRIALNASEQHQAKLVEKEIMRTVAFFPIASGLELNYLLSLLSLFAQELKHPILMQAIIDHNNDTIDFKYENESDS
jgi:hypothetical protein